jgi:competence protein ComEC
VTATLAVHTGRETRRAADLRLVPGALAAWGAAGLAVGASPRPALIGGFGALLLAGCALTLRARHPAMLAAVVVLCCGGGAAIAAGCRVAALRTGPLARLAAARAVVAADLVVASDPERMRPRPGRHGPPLVVFGATLTKLSIHGHATRVREPVRVAVVGDRWLDLLPSTAVRVAARLRTAHPGRPVAAFASVRGPPRLLSGPNAHQRVAGVLRAGLRRAVVHLPDPERGLVPALVDGDTSRLPEEIAEDFRATGLVHIDAVSGANLTILLAVVLTSARWVGLRGRAVPVLGALCVAAFVVVARPQPSVLRAAVMGALVVLAMATGRRRQGVAALAAAVLALVLVDPWLARAYGFTLSVLATGGLLVLAPGWRAALAARGLPDRLAEAVAVPAAAQVACDPVLVMLSARFSLVAIPANMLAEAAVGPVTVVGVLVMMLAPISLTLSQLVAWLSYPPAWWIVTVAHHLARLPAATVSWPASLGGALAIVGLTCALLLAGPRLIRRPFWLIATVLVLVLALLRPGLPTSWPPRDWRLVACDVGQGDGLVLPAGPGAAVVVDTGPSPAAIDGCLSSLGVRRVPVLVLSHFHADHVEGVPGVLRRRTVGQIRVARLDDPPSEAARVRQWARAAGVPVSATVAGERYQGPAGPAHSPDPPGSVGSPLSWRVLWPRPADPAAWADPNDASVVLDVRVAGLRMLLTGDVEPPAQQALLTAEPALRADVLKVPHHGSAKQVAALIRAVRPRVALVSVGAGNDYGHPAARTLRLLDSVGARTLRTDRDGTVAVFGTPGRLRVAGRRSVGRPAAPTEPRPHLPPARPGPAQGAGDGSGAGGRDRRHPGPAGRRTGRRRPNRRRPNRRRSSRPWPRMRRRARFRPAAVTCLRGWLRTAPHRRSGRSPSSSVPRICSWTARSPP